MLNQKEDLQTNFDNILIGGVPSGYEGVVLERIKDEDTPVLFVVQDDRRLASVRTSLEFFSNMEEIVEFPAWDCLPYDRISPKKDIIATRIDTLTRLADRNTNKNVIVLTTVAALLQRVPPRDFFRDSTITINPTGKNSRDSLIAFLLENGYLRSEVVMEPGEYAVRGGIVDLFPPGVDEPVRLDFFGDELDSIRKFDPFSQRSGDKLVGDVAIKPCDELFINENTISLFRKSYRALFGVNSKQDILYESISEGQTIAGIEHWSPLFYEKMETLIDYFDCLKVVFDHQVDESFKLRWTLINDCFEAREEMKNNNFSESAAIYNSLLPVALYLPPDELYSRVKTCSTIKFQPFSIERASRDKFDAGGRAGFDFVKARTSPDINIFDALKEHLVTAITAGRKVIIGANSLGSEKRLASILQEHNILFSSSFTDDVVLTVLNLEFGFISADLELITEQDLLGSRLSTPKNKKIRPENFIIDTSALKAGDLVVHAEHGVGRFDELITVKVADIGIPHDCLQLSYSGGDKLFLPVENIDIISRYGEENLHIRLDKLGGVAWQARKSALKNRIRDIADSLIAVAAARELKSGYVLKPQAPIYEEFCSRFSFTETEDQENAINDVINDMGSGRPMDRLICGDVGFGKTEVALRATFIAAMEGKQVAVIVPTTLLARQHFQIFSLRFADFPICIKQLSRLVPNEKIVQTKKGLKTGVVDIIIGTHSLLSSDVEFDRLGLLIIDEEQRFGVLHKEKLKKIKSQVHVLTLTATPIPRTLQLALTGVRELSLITTPPVDRLAVRSFVLPYDPVVVREAIQRERHRGGQIFYVCPRISDIAHLEMDLLKLIPDIRIAKAHGKMNAEKLEDIMNSFYDGKFDLLLATNIVESGLDIPNANTIILHRSEMFGLAQLYQLRGRIGRSKVRGYAYFTISQGKSLNESALKRLEVMESLDMLGAGFTLASYDLDIRGAGNLLGDEQSGHIREVGVELYQRMLEEAVAESKSNSNIPLSVEDKWSPNIEIGIPVLIPSEYVSELGIRLSLYRRIGSLIDQAQIDEFAAEMVDRFGVLPQEVENLLETVVIKGLCLKAGVEKLDAGGKGARITFRNNNFSNPAGLVELINANSGSLKLRSDHRLIFSRVWPDDMSRLNGSKYIIKELCKLIN